MVLLVAGFAGGGTPGHLLMGGGVFRKKSIPVLCNRFLQHSPNADMLAPSCTVRLEMRAFACSQGAYI